MENNTLNYRRKLQCSTPIVVLTLVALVAGIVSSITYFVSTVYDWDGPVEVMYYFPSISRLVEWLLDLAPEVLLALYVLYFFPKCKADILLPIAMLCLAVKPVWHWVAFGFHFELEYDIWFIASVVTFGLAGFYALIGSKRKVFVIFAVAWTLVDWVGSTIGVITVDIPHCIENDLMIYLVTEPAWLLETVALSVALLLLVLKNDVLGSGRVNFGKVISQVKKESVTIREKQAEQSMDPAQQLRVLKEKLDLGMITEEEYHSKREQIISQL